jgi:L-alanine-DL-glutamate epimerase-like enolase superfamily enzyme
MKITGLETVLLTAEPSEPIRWSGGELNTVQASLIVVHTDENITGLGETYTGIFAPKAVRGIVESLEPLLLGEDPTDVARLYQKMYSKTLFWARVGAGLSTIGAIETALWDILGKVKGEPVWRLLGGNVHERLPLYASGGLEKPIEETVAEMKRYREQGLRAVKVRVGMGFERDIRKLEIVRETLGDDIQLMVDAVQGHNPEPWTAAEAIRMGKAMERFHLRWFEEPCAATDYAGYANVRRAVQIPISGGESSTSIFEFRGFFEAGSLDIAQPDTAHSGGIQECRKIATLAQSYGVEIAFHSWASSVVIAPNYHLAFNTPNTSIVEYPTWGYPLRDELFSEPLDIRDGYLYPSQAPGLGVELTDEVRKKYAFRETAGVDMRRAK